ncbi:asparagine synthase (glutamine-hydrolyzing) [Myroides odoratimimus]|uniref:asparagine synthase (glutamine-hydrolyzing) n=2 Tax=Myroides odoratimimus TaxID=76832 RepID=UPI0025783E80|nr:asparagine synthase (glutamine-hydrolyzing) [Myroides odoratimimus]MDM1517187.1 asparagine synthase (glutamine-hydrolyzing) [Myroides odoratimimus]MDM1536320.1 asparagine synthase (glutamine-hydrolyzing) [Myroides odoratimimus]MDM1675892.1 asparagine synthase (glutamine-hydrolyzing) [Myroides odoratimimus]
MCGILGSINIPFGKDTLDTIYHRGPDSGAIENFSIGGNSIYFGHRRLAIVELTEAGYQPMSTVDCDYTIVFNGEVYNHLELREKLKEVSFKGNSDTETILYYLAKFGIEGVKDFNGIFSFCLLDKKNKKVYLVRDHFGVKPLYYLLEESNKLLFSSEIRPLRHYKGKLKIDQENIAELLKLRYNPSPDTIFQGILKVRPGHILEYDLEKSSIDVYSYINPVAIVKNYSFSKAVDKYGQLFEDAVKRQLMSDVEVGALLSGGIDSALVTYFAQKHSSDRIKTYTVGFEENEYANEIDDAQRSAEFLKTDHNNVIISANNFKKIFEETCRIVEEPLGTTSILPMYYLNEAVSKDLKVVLTGQGADEPLGGYTRYKGEILADKFPSFMFQLMKPIANYSKKERWIRAAQSLSIKNDVKRWENIYALFTDTEINTLINHSDYKSYDRICYYYELLKCKDKKGVEGMMAVDLRMNLADDLLMYTDKVSMNFTIETRVPMLDVELIKFLESLPYDFKIADGKTKRIHRAFAEEILPTEIINRPKKGFMSPTEKWFREDLGEYYIQMIKESDSPYFELFNKSAVLDIFEQHKKGFNREKQIFTLLSIYYLFNK